MEVNAEFWRGKRVFVTGHTGFKGGWLCLWLQAMHAEVHAYSLPPPATPNLYQIAEVAAGMSSTTIADIRDLAALEKSLQAARAEIVFHLAAQSLVRLSYRSPVETYSTNVLGTVNLLEAVRRTSSVRSVVVVTSDKCYENCEPQGGYGERSALGGADPYSSSKACAELVTSSYRRSFLQCQDVAVASARAGNVIGGGDWAEDRLIPDFFRARDANSRLKIRFPDAIRPWQHVLDPLSGYLMLAERLCSDGEKFADAWNFGPANGDAWSVSRIVEHLVSVFPDTGWDEDPADQPYEANHLQLDSSKARKRLGWRPRWDLATALHKIASWYSDWKSGESMRNVTLRQIAEFRGEDVE